MRSSAPPPDTPELPEPAALAAELQACLAAANPKGGVHATEAAEAALRAGELALRLGLPVERGRAALWRCVHLLRLARHDELLQFSRLALPQLNLPALQAERRELLRITALAGSEHGNFDVALTAAHELVRSSAGDLGPGPALLAALTLGACFERMGDSWQALRILEQALRDHSPAPAEDGSAHAPAFALPLLMTHNGVCATALGIVHRLLDLNAEDELHDVLQRARHAGEQARVLLPHHPDPTYQVAVLGNLGEVLLYQGEVAAAEPLLRGSHGLALSLGLRAHGWRVQASLGAWWLAHGDAGAALAAMQGLMAEMGDEAPPQTLVRVLNVAYRACRALGRHEEALGHFEAAERIERRRTMAQLRAQSQLFVTRSEAQQAQWQAEQARREAQQHREHAVEAAARAERDPLTGLGNRRHLQARCAELLPAAERLGRPVALAQLDLDYFKAVNDRHGHAVGDKVLVAVAQLLRENMRTDDVLVRHGGEEFVIVLPGLTLDAAAEVCERLRERLARYPWLAVCGTVIPITASIGLAAAPPYQLEALLLRADEALYRAKDDGRNQLALAP
jgi:diguanylate cyclase (GGDEF)-like protein